MPSAQRLLRLAGLLTGLCLAGLLVLALRVPASDGALGANARFSVVPPGELQVDRQRLLRARALVPGGGGAHGRVELRNITVGPVAARARLRPDVDDLDGALQVELRAGPRRLAAGTLGELRRWSRPVTIEQGETVALRARVHLPPEAGNYAGRSTSVRLELRARLLEAGP
jgi:hypothetical protein